MATTALRTTTRRSSDLSKRSAEVFAEAEDHPVGVQIGNSARDDWAKAVTVRR